MDSVKQPLPDESADEPTDDELMDLYLKLSPSDRRRYFADTAHCAETVGVSRRTILQWIDSGVIRAIPVGRKYQVWLVSLTKYLKSKAASGT